jgi:hypothetical protein
VGGLEGGSLGRGGEGSPPQPGVNIGVSLQAGPPGPLVSHQLRPGRWGGSRLSVGPLGCGLRGVSSARSWHGGPWSRGLWTQRSLPAPPRSPALGGYRGLARARSTGFAPSRMGVRSEFEFQLCHYQHGDLGSITSSSWSVFSSVERAERIQGYAWKRLQSKRVLNKPQLGPRARRKPKLSRTLAHHPQYSPHTEGTCPSPAPAWRGFGLIYLVFGGVFSCLFVWWQYLCLNSGP